MLISDTLLYLARRTRTNIKGLFYGKNGSIEPIPNGTSGQYLKMGTNGPEWGSGGGSEYHAGLFHGANNVVSGIPDGTNGQFLKMGSSGPEWGSGGVEYHAGLFHGANNEVSGIPDGTSGQFLKMGSNGPEWGAGGGSEYHVGLFHGANGEVSGIADGYEGDILTMGASGPEWQDLLYALEPTDLTLSAGAHTTIVWNASVSIGKIVYLSLEVMGKTEGASAGDVIFQRIPDPIHRTSSTDMTKLFYTDKGFLTVDPGGFCYLDSGLAANATAHINGLYIRY